MQTRRRIAFRLIGGAFLGAASWPALQALLPLLPVPVRFLLAWCLFTFGFGAAVAGYLARGLDPLRRCIVWFGAGSAVAPAVIHMLGNLNLVPVFPYLATALAGSGLASWGAASEARARTLWRDLAACATLVVLVATLGTVVFSKRLQIDARGILLYGDYDSADLGYYAAEASEASHTVPPTASYYSGHKLNAAYYPHLVPGMILRFANVPVLSIYYRYGWPTFQLLSALTAFILVRSLASTGAALLAVVLILIGSDFSYLAAWFLAHDTVQWDYLLWPTNFLSPTMEVQHFATWGPSLPVFFTILFAVVRGLQTRAWGWICLSGLLIGVLFEFKPFIYIVLMAALCIAAVLSHGDRASRYRFAAAVVLGIICTLPYVYGITQLDPADRRSQLVIDFFLLPQRMLIKLNLTDAVMEAAAFLAPKPALRTPVFLILATALFLPVGVGIRWLGAPGVWRAVRQTSGPDHAAWRLLGWIVIAGILIPFVLATDPYVDTLQFYLTGLYVMWIFTAVALAGFASRRPVLGRVALVCAIVIAIPSSAHYLSRKWTDRDRNPRASLSANEVSIANYLRTQDPETTVVLHDRPLSPSLITIVSARRIVLGWDVRYSAVGGEDRLRDVNAFYGSVEGDPADALATLHRYHVTHVIVREGDRVHPAVLAHLRPVRQFPDVSLYAVPAAAEP